MGVHITCYICKLTAKGMHPGCDCERMAWKKVQLFIKESKMRIIDIHSNVDTWCSNSILMHLQDEKKVDSYILHSVCLMPEGDQTTRPGIISAGEYNKILQEWKEYDKRVDDASATLEQKENS